MKMVLLLCLWDNLKFFRVFSVSSNGGESSVESTEVVVGKSYFVTQTAADDDDKTATRFYCCHKKRTTQTQRPSCDERQAPIDGDEVSKHAY